MIRHTASRNGGPRFSSRIRRNAAFKKRLAARPSQFTNRHEKRARVVDKVNELQGAGIVYCSTVAQCNAVHAALLDAGVDAQRYNGKMSTFDRARRKTRSWRTAHVMVATNAGARYGDRNQAHSHRLLRHRAGIEMRRQTILSHCRAADDPYEVGDLVSFWNSGLSDQAGNPIGLLITRLRPEVHLVHSWKVAQSR